MSTVALILAAAFIVQRLHFPLHPKIAQIPTSMAPFIARCAYYAQSRASEASRHTNDPQLDTLKRDIPPRS